MAQLGAVLGREFAYALIQALAPLDEATLQARLEQLVAAELLYQRGRPPRATYLFKHALIQDAAYQSLLKSTRQQVPPAGGPGVGGAVSRDGETQPELVAQHYTEAGLTEQAIPYWQRAGQQALQRSANLEAVQHLTTGPGAAGHAPRDPGAGPAGARPAAGPGAGVDGHQGLWRPRRWSRPMPGRGRCARRSARRPSSSRRCGAYVGSITTGGRCRRRGSWGNSSIGWRSARPTPTHRLEAHDALGSTLFFLGDYAAARTHLEQGIALTDPTAQRALALRHGEAPGVRCLAMAAHTLWCLGYPAQAVQRSQEALALAQALAHPYSLAVAQHCAAFLHHRRREAPAVQAQAEALLTLATAQGFPLCVGYGTCWQGWALAMQGQGEAGLAQMRQGLAAVLATGQTLARPLCLVLLAEAAGHAGQVEEGLRLLAEALTAFEASGQGDLLAEAYRLQGELLLRQAIPDAAQAEACFQQALAIARRQQAKSWELRAAMSLSSAVAAAGQARRGPRAAGTDLRLVHRGL